MMRTALGVVAGFSVWWVVTAALGFVLRSIWPAYVAAEGTFSFDINMQIARLAIGAVATLAAGAAAAYLARGWRPAAPILGVVLLVLFIPIHIVLWTKFPLWYHLTFLVSLVPLASLGGWLAPTAPVSAASET